MTAFDDAMDGIPEVTTAAPDPSFRDTLAEDIEHADWCNSNWPGKPGCDCLDHRLRQADALMPAIAAEVQARVQAATGQRAALARVDALADELDDGGHRLAARNDHYDAGRGDMAIAAAHRIRAALAQPAAATDEAGQA